ncbi:DUF333 domain-containing protein [Pseudoalteromonas sp. SSDWG2]|uniref:putative hemolysin n=1 Tax=Pseudoalteromonas sp. SSDWG2 TaxID=3139391 RepID=UPI003BADBD50
MRMIIILVCVLGLSACQEQDESVLLKSDIDMTNPALAFCVNQGGQVLVDEQMQDMYFCKLDNGSKVEAWEFYRDYQ